MGKICSTDIAFYIVFLLCQGTEIMLGLNHWSIWPPHKWSVPSIMCRNSAHVVLCHCREWLLGKLRSLWEGMAWPWSRSWRPNQQSEQVNRICVNSPELWPDFDFLSMTSLGLLISVCSRNHLVLALAEKRGPADWFRHQYFTVFCSFLSLWLVIRMWQKLTNTGLVW